jgi:hypothetical protein
VVPHAFFFVMLCALKGNAFCLKTDHLDPAEGYLLEGAKKNRKKLHFFHFFCPKSGSYGLTISGGHATGNYLMDFQPARRKAGSDTCLSLYWPIKLNEKLVVPVLYWRLKDSSAVTQWHRLDLRWSSNR